MKSKILGAVTCLLLLPMSSWTQENHQQPVTTEPVSHKVYTTLNPQLLQQSLDTLFAHSPSPSSPWNDILHQVDSLGCTWMRHQGHVYKLILIDDQCWFAENLRSDAYANGDEIDGYLGDDDWEEANANSEGAQAVYDGDDANVNLYGRLYNWHAVNDSRGLCPNHWHVPSAADWEDLIDFLEVEGNAGDQIRSSVSDTPPWDGSNSSGFSGLPGGEREQYGDYEQLGEKADWWSSTPDENNKAFIYKTTSDADDVWQGTTDQGEGKSVRCLRN